MRRYDTAFPSFLERTGDPEGHFGLARRLKGTDHALRHRLVRRVACQIGEADVQL